MLFSKTDSSERTLQPLQREIQGDEKGANRVGWWSVSSGANKGQEMKVWSVIGEPGAEGLIAWVSTFLLEASASCHLPWKARLEEIRGEVTCL